MCVQVPECCLKLLKYILAGWREPLQSLCPIKPRKETTLYDVLAQLEAIIGIFHLRDD
jgi:hypothetical protein